MTVKLRSMNKALSPIYAEVRTFRIPVLSRPLNSFPPQVPIGGEVKKTNSLPVFMPSRSPKNQS
jgi:hypothetical protein